MRKLAILALLIILIPSMVASAAETPTEIEYFDIYFLPELDDASVLVIMQIDFLSAGEGITTTFNLPAGIENLVVARIDADGTPVVNDITYSSEETGGMTVVTINSATDGIWLEYYDTNLVVDGSTHSFTYECLQDFDVDKYDIRIQQPYNSLNMVTSPELGSTWTDTYGLNSFGDGFDSLGAESDFTFTFSYQKDDLVPSLVAMGSVVPEADNVLSSDNPEGLPDWALILIGVGVAVALGAALYFFYLRNQNSAPAGRTRKRTSSARYCQSCGKKAKADDVFCRQCGNKIRK